jgi:type IV secretory pathway VirB9-like protein
MKHSIHLAMAALLLAGSGSVMASKVSPCKEIHWEPYQVYTVKSSLHQRTHIILPEPIQGVPVPGNPVLWDVDGENIHLFIKPKNFGNAEGGNTTVTAVAVSNNSYDFSVTRVKHNPDICIRIVKESAMPMGQKQGWMTPEQRVNRGLEAENMALKQQLVQAQAQKNVAVENALMAYRSNVFTGYEWKGGKGFFAGNSVSDVWDDGRFTFVRLTQPGKGIMTVTAVVNGKEEMADYKWDPATQVYMITGLYPSFIMRYDESEITITRVDTVGS